MAKGDVLWSGRQRRADSASWIGRGVGHRRRGGRALLFSLLHPVDPATRATCRALLRIALVRQDAGPIIGSLRPTVTYAWLALTVVGFSISHWVGLASQRATSETGRYLLEHSAPNDRIFVWGQAPRIYLEARRRPACRLCRDISAYRLRLRVERAEHLPYRYPQVDRAGRLERTSKRILRSIRRPTSSMSRFQRRTRTIRCAIFRFSLACWRSVITRLRGPPRE